MQETTTRVPAVVDRIIVVARAAMTGWTVWDGPRETESKDVPDQLLIVGVGNSENANSYSSATELQPGLDMRLVEVITVRCELSTWTGDTSETLAVQPKRAALGTALGQLDFAFRADPELAHTCDAVFVGGETARWYVLQSPDGAGLGVEFSITARAWL